MTAHGLSVELRREALQTESQGYSRMHVVDETYADYYQEELDGPGSDSHSLDRLEQGSTLGTMRKHDEKQLVLDQKSTTDLMFWRVHYQREVLVLTMRDPPTWILPMGIS